MKRALLIYNPAARKAPPFETLRGLADRVSGWQIDVRNTESAGHATALARNAVIAAYDVVVACGGDGTVNEVANGLARSETALAVLRGGTANVWAKEAGVPKQAGKALQLLAEGELRRIDLGRVADRYFVCMGGLGFDAEIVRQMMNSALKKRIGAAAYIVTGVKLARRYRSSRAELWFDGQSETLDVFWLMVGNTRNYGGVLNIAHMAKANDGQLETLLLGRGGLWTLMKLLPLVLLKRHHRSKLVEHRSISSLNVSSAGLPVQVDGEYIGETPALFSVEPAALSVIVPRRSNTALFSKESL